MGRNIGKYKTPNKTPNKKNKTLKSIISCCNVTSGMEKQRKIMKCKRKSDGKIFDLPRRFTRKECARNIRGFTMRSSCAPYIGCLK